MRIVDLSHRLDETVQVYPGDPVFTTSPAATLDADGFNVAHVAMGTHTGTHVDAPFHVVADGARVDECDLALFAGPAVVVDVRGRGPRERITWADLQPSAERMGPGRMVLLHTGWSVHFRSERYLQHPYLDAEAAERVLATGVPTLGVDTLNPDETVLDGGAGLPVHEAVLGAGGVIAENLTNLAALDGVREPLVSMLPLALAHADGAPVRAVALLDL
ncbi:cyclase family protein [Quadrisphaera sp. DSM 44207]|uniref:cyclase family protein n=1 Tax=Quadrisphaera sp. DSM 44207 TaxID=1881057 RepID=UPI00088E0C8D|nr:cyclase family protein [Quadrisphaera sp. DSM 44207]SDQ85393.1 Kynurenine formamidase [Quadrisphaera sp. DSM 44207]